MKRLRAAAVILAVQSLMLGATQAVRFGKLIDGQGGVLTRAIVIVEGDRIYSVGGADSAIPAGTSVLAPAGTGRGKVRISRDRAQSHAHLWSATTGIKTPRVLYRSLVFAAGAR